MNNETLVHFADPAVQICPFSAYSEIRKASPVYRDPDTGHYFILDHKLVRSLAGNTEQLSNQCGILNKVEGPHQQLADRVLRENGGFPMMDVLVSGDPPDHSFHRSFVDKAFSAARIRKVEAYIVALADEMIGGFIDDGTVDFHNRVSVILPMTIIADQLGFPRSDLETFKRWSEASVKRVDARLSEQEMTRVLIDHCELQKYVAAKAQVYRETPADCLLSDLVHTENQGRRLSIEEVVAIASVLIVAGNETTTSAISSGIYRLAKDQALQNQLREHPEHLQGFIDETLRMDAPLQGLFRRAKVDIDVAGIVIPAGSILMLRWGAANRDPAIFPEPDTFDPMRPNARSHLTFGYGAHFCVGNQLARTELMLVFSAVLQRLRGFRLTDEEDSVKYSPNYIAYGFEKLCLTFEKT